MPRLPLGDIELALGNPAAYRRKLNAPANGGFGSTYMSTLRNAVYRYHATGDDAEARQYIENALTRSARLRSKTRRAETLAQLDWYVTEHQQRGWDTFQTRLRLDITLPSRVPDDFRCSGEIARLDLVPSGGYAAWLVTSEVRTDWPTELRFSLVQGTLAARTLSVPPSEVTVGVCAVRTRTTQLHTYSQIEISAAFRRLDQLLSDLGY